jgi:hypothetical protein
MLIVIGAAVSVSAQEPTGDQAGATDPELVKLQKEIELEKKRTELAVQRRKTLDASLPKSSKDEANETLKGEIKVQDKQSTYETESTALSYEALSEIAKQVSGQLRTRTDFNQVVIYSAPDFQCLIQYRIFETQATPALTAYDMLLRPASESRGFDKSVRGVLGSEIMSVPEIGTAFMKSAIDFISLFRTDTTITNKPVAIEETALGALVANELIAARPNYKVYFPGAYIPEHEWDPRDENSVLTQLTNLYAYSAVAKEIVADYNQTKPEERAKHPYHNKISALKTLNQQVDRMLANYQTDKGEDQRSHLRELVRAEQLSRMLGSDPKTGILQLKVLDAGGSERISRNLIFGSKVRHSGSVIAEYLLFDQAGALRSSDTFYYHTGFQKMEKARETRQN